MPERTVKTGSYFVGVPKKDDLTDKETAILRDFVKEL